MGWAFQFAPTGAFTLEANVIFSTYALALAYAKTDPTAVVGKVISVDSGEEKGVYMIEAIGESGSLKKVGSDIDLSNYVTKDQLTNIYTYKGTVVDYNALLALTNPAVGDVYNVESNVIITKDQDFETYPGGTNWVWNGTSWDALAGSIDLSGYALKTEVETLSTNTTTSISGLQGQITELSTSINKKVDAQDNHSLISAEKLALIDTNAADIQALEDKDLDNRLSTLEGMFKDGESNIDLSQITATLSEHTTQIGNKADKSVVEELSSTVSDHGTRLATVEANNATQTTDISNLSTKVSGLETSHGNAISGLTTTVEGHTTEIGNIKSSISGLAVKSVKADEKVLAADSNGALSTTIKLAYDSDNKKIQLKGISDAVIDELDATVFVKDGMLDKAEYDVTNNKIVLTWNTDAGKNTMDIPMESLVDTYTAGSGLVVTENEFSVKLDTNSNNKLTVSDSGLLVDISSDIAALKSTMDTKISDAFTWINVEVTE